MVPGRWALHDALKRFRDDALKRFRDDFVRRCANAVASKRPQQAAEAEPESMGQAPGSPDAGIDPVAVDREAQLEFAARCRKFRGLFNALYLAILHQLDAQQCRQLLSEWEDRIKSRETPSLTRVWKGLVQSSLGSESVGELPASAPESALAKMAKSWHDTLLEWDVHRDEATSMKIDPSSAERYIFDVAYQIGDTADIKIPCWTFKGQVVELGACPRIRVRNPQVLVIKQLAGFEPN